MINQQMIDVEFDTYFNVTSSTMQSSQQKQKQKSQPQLQPQLQQQQQQQKMMYNNSQRHLSQQQEVHPTQQLNMSQFNPQHYYLSKSSKQQSSAEMMNWPFDQQGATNLHMQNNHNPASTHVPFTSTQTSPRPDYFYSTGQTNSAGTTPSELLLSQPSPQQLQYCTNNNEDQLRYGYQRNMDYQLPNEPVNKKTGLITPESDTIISPRPPHALPSNSNSPSSTSSETLHHTEKKTKVNNDNNNNNIIIDIQIYLTSSSLSLVG